MWVLSSLIIWYNTDSWKIGHTKTRCLLTLHRPISEVRECPIGSIWCSKHHIKALMCCATQLIDHVLVYFLVERLPIHLIVLPLTALNRAWAFITSPTGKSHSSFIVMVIAGYHAQAIPTQIARLVYWHWNGKTAPSMKSSCIILPNLGQKATRLQIHCKKQLL